MREIPNYLKKHYGLIKSLTKLANRCHPRNRLHARGCEVQLGLNRLQGLKILSWGTDNRVILEDYARMKNCTILLGGSHNTVRIGKYCHLTDATFVLEDDGNEISVGTHTYICGDTELAAIEGTRITVGPECMFSGGIRLRTGDSHSLLDADTGKRINPSRDITLGEHVWVGTQVTVLKGVTVADNSVCAATATLTGTYDSPGAVIGGVPARILKTGVTWTMQRIPMEE